MDDILIQWLHTRTSFPRHFDNCDVRQPLHSSFMGVEMLLQGRIVHEKHNISPPPAHPPVEPLQPFKENDLCHLRISIVAIPDITVSRIMSVPHPEVQGACSLPNHKGILTVPSISGGTEQEGDPVGVYIYFCSHCIQV